MRETRRMAEEVNRMGEEMQARAQKFEHEYEKPAATGFEAASRSFGEANRGFQALGAEMMSYSKEVFDDAVRTWERLIGVKSLDQAIQIQSDYAKRCSENHMAELSKLGQMYVGLFSNAAKPLEQASKGFAQTR